MPNLAGVGAAGDGVGQRRTGIGVGRRDCRDGGAVLRHIDRSRRTAAVRGDDRDIVVEVGDGDGDVLDVRIAAVGDLYLDVVDVVAASVGGASVSGADTKDSAPLEALIANLAASAPPTME